MNTLPTTILPTQAMEPAAGRPQDTGGSETPFSQVLSDEMTAQRKTSANKRDADTAPSKSAAPATDAGKPSTNDEEAEDAFAADAEASESATTHADAIALLGLAPAAPQGNVNTLPGPESVAQDTQPGASATPVEQGTDAADLLGVASASAPHAQSAPTAGADQTETTPTASIAQSQTADPGSRQAVRSGGYAEAAAAGTGRAGPKGEAPVSGNATPQAPLQAAATEALAAGRQQATAMPPVAGNVDLMFNAALRAAPQALQEAAAFNSEVAQPRLGPAVGSAAWSQALGERIVWMAAASQQTATLTLNPPNLGPLQVVLNLSNDQAAANFFAAQPEVRQALEAAFPRLKDMMSEAGIQLQQATVSADTPQPQQDPSGRSPQGAGRVLALGAGNDDPSNPVAAAVTARVGHGLIDTFA